MAEQDDAPEGWHVRHRPALIAAAAVPVTLFALLLVAGRIYNAELRPKTWRPVTAQPARRLSPTEARTCIARVASPRPTRR